jgi:hypothetical protein
MLFENVVVSPKGSRSRKSDRDRGKPKIIITGDYSEGGVELFTVRSKYSLPASKLALRQYSVCLNSRI